MSMVSTVLFRVARRPKLKEEQFVNPCLPAPLSHALSLRLSSHLLSTFHLVVDL